MQAHTAGLFLTCRHPRAPRAQTAQKVDELQTAIHKDRVMLQTGKADGGGGHRSSTDPLGRSSGLEALLMAPQVRRGTGCSHGPPPPPALW